MAGSIMDFAMGMISRNTNPEWATLERVELRE